MAEIRLSKIRWLVGMAFPKIGNRPIAKITTQEVLTLLIHSRRPACHFRLTHNARRYGPQ
ncbi:hypothetical protein [Sphingobium sp. TomMM35A]